MRELELGSTFTLDWRCTVAGSTTYDIDASETVILGRSRSSFNRELSSFSRRSFRSAIDCFLFLTSPPARISYAAGISAIASCQKLPSSRQEGVGDAVANDGRAGRR